VVHYIADSIVLIVSCYGIAGATKLDHKHLKQFLILLVILFIYMCAYIIITTLTLHTHLTKLLADCFTAGALFLGIMFTADLTWAIGGTTSKESAPLHYV
jgi:hypothetical protein